jgi:hypothetical protein
VKAFQRDVRKLLAFRDIGYAAAFFIVFGSSVDRVRKYAREMPNSALHLQGIELYHHQRPGEAAVLLRW